MKVINKLVCFLLVLVLCVPLLCFNVSAISYNTDDISDYFWNLGDKGYSDYIKSNSFLSNYPYVFCDDYIHASSFDDYSNINRRFFDFSDIKQRFYTFLTRYTYYNSIKGFNGNINDDFYYAFYSGQASYNSTLSDCGVLVLSFSPFSLVSDGSSSYFQSDTGDSIYLGYGYYTSSSDAIVINFNDCGSNTSSSNGNNKRIYYNSDYSSTLNPYFTISGSSVIYTFDSFYSNIHNLSLPDSYTYSDIPGTSALKDNIEVKLTPAFGLDMDRIDSLTNQSDYFKFEISNNSDSAIQWCAGIYDPELVTADTMDILNLSSWAYVSRTTYYDFSVKEDKGIFRTTYTYSGALKTGSFDYHYLQPGETFSDLIFWENINIKPNVIYHFFVNAVKTDLKYASLNIDPPVTEESSDMHSVTVIEDTYFNTILEGASSFRKLDCNIFNIDFSCLSMPAFTTTVRGGNSVLNTSGNDRYKLYNNFETVSDINGLDTKINKNYTDPAILANTFNRSDVSVDIDSFSVDDVKSYITSCQSFFILIKEALLSFPAFIWALICFGLTGLIVIAVVKALL